MKTEKGKKGFTLAELLIVVAIIGVLLAIAIPNVISYYRSLKLTELDDSARSIFVAAQNRLTAMKSAGENLNALCSGNITVALASGGSAEVGTVTNKEKLDALVLGGSIEAQLHENHYVVEIDPKTGAVFAVWYWEKDGYTYKNADYGTADMTRDKRLEAGTMVGYYGGDPINRLSFKQMPFPSVKVINGEELRVQITVPTMSFGAGVSGYNDNNVWVDVLVNGVKIVEDANLWPDNDPLTPRVGTVVLDTLKPGGATLDDVPYQTNFSPTAHKSTSGNSGWTYGMQYKEWTTAYGTTFPAPGEELTVTVKLRYNGTVNIGGAATGLTPQTVTVQCNSLFESAEEIMDATGTGTGNYTAHIAYGRHLQNLDKGASDVADSVVGAVQTRNIDFDDVTTVTGEYSWQNTYGDTPFTPINNGNLTSYDGQELIIRNLHIEETGNNNVGLFGGPETALRNIRLEDATVEGGSNVGALAGSYMGTEIINCGVYVSDSGHYDTCTVTGSGITGGLVGYIDNSISAVEIEKSFAAVKVAGTASSVGGLVGQVDADVTLTDCYSGGHTVDGKYTTDANVTGNEAVGGLVGQVDDGRPLTLAGTDYSTCSVKTTGTALDEVGLLVGGNTGSVTNNGKAYATGEAFDSTNAKITTGLRDETAYLDTDFGNNAQASFVTHPYDSTLKGKYPYATGLGEHYGDWLEETVSAQSLCYFDLVNGSYGVWGYIDDPANPGTPTFVNTLTSGTPNSGICATDDGYCIPVETGTAAPAAPTIGGTPYTVSKLSGTATIDGKEYDLYKVEGLNGIGATPYYNTITVGTMEYYFNPFFACEIIQKTAGSTAPATPQAKNGAAGQGTTEEYSGQVVIRTARQLANMAEQTGSSAAQDRSYVQLLDIDFNTYAQTNLAGKEGSSVEWTPMKLSSSGSYDGKKFVISNLYINKTGNDIGLFGDTSGKLESIQLKNVKVTGRGQRVGALAGRFRGTTITNCGVYVDASGSYDDNRVEGVEVSGDSNSGRRVGGLIGNINSEATLTGCFAAVKVIGTQQVGGLIGSLAIDKNNATLENCYSGGHTAGGVYSGSDANVTGEFYTGGLIGCLNGDDTEVHTLTLKGVNYSTCSVKMTSTSTSSSIKERIGLLIGGKTNAAELVPESGSTAYAIGATYNSSGVSTPREETYLTSPAVTTKSGFTTHHYDDTLTGDYPYETNLDEHYGDWPNP